MRGWGRRRGLPDPPRFGDHPARPSPRATRPTIGRGLPGSLQSAVCEVGMAGELLKTGKSPGVTIPTSHTRRDRWRVSSVGLVLEVVAGAVCLRWGGCDACGWRAGWCRRGPGAKAARRSGAAAASGRGSVGTQRGRRVAPTAPALASGGMTAAWGAPRHDASTAKSTLDYEARPRPAAPQRGRRDGVERDRLDSRIWVP
jgi:hypothetical protein